MGGLPYGGGGMPAKKVCLPKMGLSFWALYSQLHCSLEDNFLVLFGWVNHPPPPRW